MIQLRGSRTAAAAFCFIAAVARAQAPATAKCEIDCAKGGSCQKLVCVADECDVSCRGDDACNTNADISLTGKTRASLDCNGKRACRTTKTSCAGADCTMSCTPKDGGDNACPSTIGPCTAAVNGACDGWNQPNSNN